MSGCKPLSHSVLQDKCIAERGNSQAFIAYRVGVKRSFAHTPAHTLQDLQVPAGRSKPPLDAEVGGCRFGTPLPHARGDDPAASIHAYWAPHPRGRERSPVRALARVLPPPTRAGASPTSVIPKPARRAAPRTRGPDGSNSVRVYVDETRSARTARGCQSYTPSSTLGPPRARAIRPGSTRTQGVSGSDTPLVGPGCDR